MRDAIIVGGGPIGCFIGEKLAEDGFDVSILEEHPEIGQPMCCAGIVGAEGLKEVGLDPERWALKELREGVFHPPSGDPAKLSRGRTEAYVIDRAQFDRDLAKRAVKAGAEIEFNSRCTGVSRRNDGAVVEIENMESLKTRLVIGADGTNSIVARSLGLIKDFSPLVCAQAEIAGNAEEKKTHVHLRNNLSESFFTWVVPAGNFYRVGLGDEEGNISDRLLNFMDEEPSLPENPRKKIVRFTTDLIPSSRSRKIYGERVMLAGDAAGHVKPLTGGGLYLGISGAKIASEIAADVLGEEPTEENLREYGNRVEEIFGKEFELGGRARNILKKMSDEDLDDVIDLLKNPEVEELILENAEFDRHSSLFKAMLEKGPSLISSIGTRKLAKFLSWLASP